MKKLFTALTCSVLLISYALASSTDLPDFAKDQKSSSSTSGSSQSSFFDPGKIAETKRKVLEIRQMMHYLFWKPWHKPQETKQR